MVVQAWEVGNKVRKVVGIMSPFIVIKERERERGWGVSWDAEAWLK